MGSNTTNDRRDDNKEDCLTFIVNRARQLNQAFGYLDLKGRFAYGTLRNAIRELGKRGEILKFEKENPARFVLASWRNRPEYEKCFRNDKNPMRVRASRSESRVNFSSLVESLDWEELAHVHDVKIEFESGCFKGVRSETEWHWIAKSRSRVRKFRDMEFPLTVQLYASGHVQVSVRCSVKPVPFGFEGLSRLVSVLGELKGRLGWIMVPNVMDWIVTSWHYGKDCKQEVSGHAFNVTFKIWSERLARIYFKRDLQKIRVEEIQSPRRTVQDLFEIVMNREASR